MSTIVDWSDIERVPQDDGPNPVVSIAYGKDFSDLMDLFRGVMAVDERSERALQLTEEVIDENPANYTAWYYRRKILESVGADLGKELNFMDTVISENAKNYQVWYHRRTVAEQLGNGEREVEFTAHVLLELDDDAKNYHAWAHRQWALKKWNLFEYGEGELAFVNIILKRDLRNNSAWNQRYFVVSQTDDVNKEEIRKREVDFAIEWIRKAPNNQSPWNYLAAFLRLDNKEDNVNAFVKSTCEELRSKFPSSPHAVSMLGDLYVSSQQWDDAGKCFQALMDGLDVFRAKYWQYRLDRLTSLRAETTAQRDIDD